MGIVQQNADFLPASFYLYSHTRKTIGYTYIYFFWLIFLEEHYLTLD